MSLWHPRLFFDPATAEARPLVGCSACLLGEAVRYDGGHREHAPLHAVLPHLQLQAICPEVGIGLGVPRQTLKVIDADFGPRVVQVNSPRNDVTDALLDYADSYARRIGQFWPLTAYIFKARSPSCGVGSTLVNPGEAHERPGDGLFAQRFRTWAPWLSLYEEDDLQTEEACLELMFLSFICRDIVWRGAETDVEAKAAHYREQLGLQELSASSGNQGLWWALKKNWQQCQREQRREIIEGFSAA